MSKSLKKDENKNHFELGGKLLISADPNGPIRLLETEKSVIYNKPK